MDRLLEDIRPRAVCVDKSPEACSDPATLRQGAVERYGDLYVQTGSNAVMQWHGKYFSQVWPV